MDQTSSHIDQLIAQARSVLGGFTLGDGSFTAGTCAAAIQTVSGDIFTGICMDMACGIGFCAEHAAVAQMLKTRQTHIQMCVAVNTQGIITPCGRCRELLVQIDKQNLGTCIVINEHQTVTLNELLPKHWLGSK